MQLTGTGSSDGSGTFGICVVERAGGLERGVASVGRGFLAVVGVAGVGVGRPRAEEHLDGSFSTHDVDAEALRIRER